MLKFISLAWRAFQTDKTPFKIRCFNKINHFSQFGQKIKSLKDFINDQIDDFYCN